MVVDIQVWASKDTVPLPLYKLNGKKFNEIEFYKKDGDYSIITDGIIEIYSEYIVLKIENTPMSITRLDGIVEWVLS